jgi:hypothetical protein
MSPDGIAAQQGELWPTDDPFPACLGTLRRIVQDLPGALGCGAVDLLTGALLAVHPAQPEPAAALLEAAAQAAAEVYWARDFRQLENLLGRFRDVTPQQALDEIYIAAPSVSYFLKLYLDRGFALVLLADGASDPTAGWASLRSASPACPPATGDSAAPAS